MEERAGTSTDTLHWSYFYFLACLLACLLDGGERGGIDLEFRSAISVHLSTCTYSVCVFGMLGWLSSLSLTHTHTKAFAETHPLSFSFRCVVRRVQRPKLRVGSGPRQHVITAPIETDLSSFPAALRADSFGADVERPGLLARCVRSMDGRVRDSGTCLPMSKCNMNAVEGGLGDNTAESVCNLASRLAPPVSTRTADPQRARRNQVTWNGHGYHQTRKQEEGSI